MIAQGSMMVEQDGRQAHLDPGDFSFVDLSRPCHWANRSAAHGVAVVFPRAVLPLSQDELAEITGTCIPGNQSIGGLVSSLALQMPKLLGECAAADGARLSTSCWRRSRSRSRTGSGAAWSAAAVTCWTRR